MVIIRSRWLKQQPALLRKLGTSVVETNKNPMVETPARIIATRIMGATRVTTIIRTEIKTAETAIIQLVTPITRNRAIIPTPTLPMAQRQVGFSFGIGLINTLASASISQWNAPNITVEKQKRDKKLANKKPKDPILVDDKVFSRHYERDNLKQELPSPVENTVQTVVKENLDSL